MKEKKGGNPKKEAQSSKHAEYDLSQASISIDVPTECNRMRRRCNLLVQIAYRLTALPCSWGYSVSDHCISFPTPKSLSSGFATKFFAFVTLAKLQIFPGFLLPGTQVMFHYHANGSARKRWVDAWPYSWTGERRKGVICWSQPPGLSLVEWVVLLPSLVNRVTRFICGCLVFPASWCFWKSNNCSYFGHWLHWSSLFLQINNSGKILSGLIILQERGTLAQPHSWNLPRDFRNRNRLGSTRSSEFVGFIYFPIFHGV